MFWKRKFPKEVLDKIEEAGRTGAKELDLSNHGLTILPEALWELTQLETLILGDSWSFHNDKGNRLNNLPKSITKLGMLKGLYLSANNLSSLPKNIGDLTNLTVLYLNGNRLKSLPQRIGKLAKLEILLLNANQLNSLSESIYKLDKLTCLDLGGNNLGRISEKIGSLTNLTQLYFYNNNLRNIPESVAELTNLRKLILRKNRLSQFPENILQLKNLTHLDLGGNHINSLPESISKLVHLKRLNLNENQISILPENITNLKNLEELSLRRNKLANLPESISQLTNLSVFVLDHNGLKDFPKGITRMRELRFLELSSNLLNSLPESIGELVNLTSLHLERNHLVTLPQGLTKLINLKVLNLSENQLIHLPVNIGTLTKLEEIDIHSNSLNSLPESIGELKSLTALNLEYNQLSSLPKSICNLTNLTAFSFFSNPLISPPPEIADAGIGAIRNYFEDLGKDGVRLNEAKILLVGQGLVGKTSLKNKLKNPDFDIQSISESARTHGIKIDQWNIDCELENKEQEVIVNIWDFGGQEIYHATHQFFLTKRSVYILLGHTVNLEDNNFKYWLNIINQLGGDSPIIVVMNKVDLYQTQINQADYKNSFPQIQSFHHISTLTGYGMGDLISEIKKALAGLPHLGNDIPAHWQEIRQRLQKDERDYIEYDEYLNICEEYGMKEDKASTFIDYIHDLGNVLYFKKNKLLRNYIILKPEWGTQAIYQLLDPKLTPKFMKEQLGHFVFEDLRKIWQERRIYKGQARNILLELMLTFELCFKLQDTETYIVPQLLPENPPQSADLSPFQSSNKRLDFEYRYDFMPKGLMTRFICRIHKQIKDKSFWKSGVILQFENSLAYISHRFLQRKISIQLVGANNKELLAIIRSHFDHIHRSLNNLKVQEMIPCICSECFDKESANFFEHSHLKRAIDKGKKTVECKYSFEDVSVHALMAGIEYNTNVEKIKQLLSKGDIDVAFEELKKARLDEHQVISLEGRWNRLVNSHTKGILDQEQYTTESNSIADAILLLLPKQY